MYVDPNENFRIGTVIKDRGSLAYYMYEREKKDLPWIITYYPTGNDLVEEIDKLSKNLRLKRQPFCLCIDEFFNFSNVGQKISLELCRLIRVRASLNATIILVSHKPTDIPPVYINTVDRWATFRQTYKPDIDRLRSDTGCQNAIGVQNLKKHELAFWDEEDLEFFDRHGNPIPMPVKEKEKVIKHG